MSTIVAKALMFKQEGRAETIELHQNDSSKEVSYGYFKMAATVYDLGTKAHQRKKHQGRKNQRIVVVDVFHNCVLWGYESKDGYRAGFTRFSRITTKKGRRGFYVKGQFLEL
jgi:hypothetical protein